ncbi:hypothetical protein [Chelativorans xinjiangense]|nr:hypothetical protein [Chelativorans xinjiangense]
MNISQPVALLPILGSGLAGILFGLAYFRALRRTAEVSRCRPRLA